MIITINGDEGAGKTTIAKKLAEALNFSCLNNGDFVRKLAKEKGITLVELRQLRKESPDIDYQLDEKVVHLGKNEDNFAIVGRTAFHLIPQSIKIYLSVDPKIGAERSFKEMENSHDRDVEDKNFNTLENIIASQERRRLEDDEIYKKHYGVDIRDKANYDLVLDTSHLDIKQVTEKVLAFVSAKHKNGKSSSSRFKFAT